MLKVVLFLVAFCFYNLSSIVNGLVYFDQVSLLPASHLLLVTVGIVILLGGVWAVSLQAVNVGTWSNSNDVDVSLMEDGIANEPSLPECNPTLTCPVPQSPEREHARSHSETAALAHPHSPVISRRRTHHHIPGQISLGGTLPVGSPPSSAVPAPGFSIGLSPASPGFVIVPRDRRRCVSAQSGGDVWDEVARRIHTRRIMNDTPGDEVEQGREEAGENDGTDPGGRAIRARGRWKWLRRLILRL